MSFTCPRCGAVSYHPKDEQYSYCGACHDFTEGENMRVPSVKINTQCWNCGYKMTDVTSADPRDVTGTPSNGDLTMCMECGSFAIFDDTFPDKIRKPNPSENFEIKLNKQLQNARIVLWAIKNGMIKRD